MAKFTGIVNGQFKGLNNSTESGDAVTQAQLSAAATTLTTDAPTRLRLFTVGWELTPVKVDALALAGTPITVATMPDDGRAFHVTEITPFVAEKTGNVTVTQLQFSIGQNAAANDIAIVASGLTGLAARNDSIPPIPAGKGLTTDAAIVPAGGTIKVKITGLAIGVGSTYKLGFRITGWFGAAA